MYKYYVLLNIIDDYNLDTPPFSDKRLQISITHHYNLHCHATILPSTGQENKTAQPKTHE